MKFGVNKLSSAVRLVLSLGAVTVLGATGTALAQDAGSQTATQTPPSPQKAATLQTVVVTGSHIPRVDLETASPVVTIDSAAIKASGKLTLGDLVQQLPAVTGGGINPQVNNGGGSGSSSIGLRGLGPNRTLILVDGHRVLNKDVNSIPASAIEHIDVLTTGASSVYGSDAVGGVVNFILKRNYQGAQFSANYGESDHNDGAQHGYTFTFGQTSDKGSIMGGVDYNKMDSISSSARKFSTNAVSLTTTGHGALSRFVGGSSSSPYGHIQIPAALAGAYPGCTSGFLARNPGASGANALTDYHCYQNSGPNSDKFNYAAVNLITTPQERTNVFVLGNYNLSDHVTAYMDAYYNKTSAAFALAPGVYGTPYGASLSAQSYFNPFGIDYNGVNGAQFNERLSALGPRTTSNTTTTGQIHTGLKGAITLGNQDWNWDVGLDYGHTSETVIVRNLPNTAPLYAGSQASFLNAQGQVQCGTPAAPISLSACTPFNPFNLDSPASQAALAKAAVPTVSNIDRIERIWYADINGSLFDLPAGTVQLAAGLDYRKDYQHSQVDSLLQIDYSTGTCVLGSQCTSSTQGGYTTKEAYAEAFIPVLKDLPGIQSLNLTLGDRFSKFSDAGSTNDAKLALEWKPINDLLLRGTVAQVFRAPNLGDLYGAGPPPGPAVSADTVKNDPCTGYTGNPVNPACVNVPTDGTFVNQNVVQALQDNALNTGAVLAGVRLKPEKGKTFDLGAVYSPSWAPGLSATVDVWHLYLNDAITPIFTQSVLNLCGADQTYYCQFVHRIASGPSQGQLASNFTDPTVNLGNTSAGGIDISANYKLPQFDRFGQFTLGMNGTYLKYYNVNTAPGTPANTEYHDAGHFQPTGSAAAAACPGASGSSNCLFARWRAQGYVNWQMGGWDASWRMRYISRFQMGSKSPSQDVHPAGPNLDGVVLKYGATVYNDVSVGYNIEPLHTRVDFGVNNLFDKQPPFMFANNTLNANTDPTDFDLVGRYFWGRITVSF